MNRHFSKEGIQQAFSKLMKKCSMSVIMRETQVQTTMRYHFTSVIMAVLKKSKTRPGAVAHACDPSTLGG